MLPGIIPWSYPTPTKSFIPVCDHSTKSILLVLSHTQKVIAVYPPLSKIVLSANRFVSRPAPASPESSASQVLVRQEVESGEETAINSETFGLISRLLYLSRKCDMFSCFLQFMALVSNPSYCRGSWIAKDSRRKRSGVAACLRSPTIYCEFQRSLQSD